MSKSILSLFLFPIIGMAAELSSPNQQIKLTTHSKNEKISYSVEFNGKTIISESRLGMQLNKDAFSGGVAVTESSTRSQKETWKSVWGNQSEHLDHFNELTLKITETAATKRNMQIILRAYDDGIAFRYAYPKQENLKQANLTKELSQVALVAESMPVAWYPASTTTLVNNASFDSLRKRCRTPFTVQIAEDCFVSLHEAAVVNSADATLSIGRDQRTLTFNSKCKQGTGTVSPWRTIQIAEKPGDLVDSSLILNLNEPCKLTDTSWIKPGVSLWDWRNHGGKADDGFVYGINTESYIRYIDFAKKHKLDHVLIDAEWYGPERSRESDPITYEHEVDIPKVANYAKENGIGLWLYINDKALKAFDMDRTFAQYQKWGIAGIKHGFLSAGNQVKNAFSVKVLKKCAEYQLMYVIHEPNKPTGLSRTYPNFMASEYVNSMLDSASRTPATPAEICTFPVVHNLSGPVDRSCGLFDLDNSISRAKVHKQIPSTVISQAAQCLIFPSGFLTLPDMPDAYERKKDIFQFIKQLPMNYDESRVLDMKIGEHFSIARRSDTTWIVASVANEKGLTTEITLDFLKPGITYDVTLFEDTPESHYKFPGEWSKQIAKKKKLPFKPVKTQRELYQIKNITAKRGDTITAKIAPGGGHCMWIRPQQ